MIQWRLIAIIVLLTLSVIDLGLTYYYINKYKKWQSNKPYNMIELNPLLVVLWNNLGLLIGTILGGIVILTLIYIVAKTAHFVIVILLGLFLLFALFNHYTNINLLHQLIEKYPLGHLPEQVFGKVVGNN